MSDTESTTDDKIGCQPDGKHAPCPIVSLTGATKTPPAPAGAEIAASCGVPDPEVPQVVGEPIAVAFAGDGSVVVQSREPAMLAFATGSNVTLSDTSRADTGHKVFHANAGGGIACASCHAEGDDDGRVWNFACTGARRTQSLQTGLRGTEPFHWSGDEVTIDALMKDVFVGRMSGPMLTIDQTTLMLNWIDGQPRPVRATPSDPAAVARGHALFNDTERVGCVSCHSGARFSNNQSMDVGTGAMFQVPSLVGIGTRGPFMHNGCAPTLRERFTPSCGGTKHGAVDHLSPAQLSDLIAYLESI
jgi:mono/diheme cytochrome c family protein